MKTFFLVGSLITGATFTVGSAEAAKVMWIGLVIIGLCVFWFRKTRQVEKAPVPTEYSELEVREIYTALSLAKSAAPFRKERIDYFSPDGRDD